MSPTLRAAARSALLLVCLVFTSSCTRSRAGDSLEERNDRCTRGDAGACVAAAQAYEVGAARDPSRAVLLLQRACDGGNGEGCRRLGYLYHYGHAVQRSAEQAARLFERACQAGRADSCEILGNWLARGIGLQKDESKSEAVLRDAMALAEKSCKSGDLDNCGALGRMILGPQPHDWARPDGVFFDDEAASAPRDGARGTELLRRACDGGVTRWCGWLARADYSHSQSLAQRACDGGDGESCLNLATELLDVGGIVADRARVTQLLQRACDLGSPWERGCFELAYLVLHAGDNVYGNVPSAGELELYRRSCDSDCAPACSEMAELHVKGKGVPEDADRAKQLFWKSCKLGSDDGCLQLGTLLLGGAAQDARAAASLFARSCEAGSREGCTQLASCYLNGKGVKKDRKRAVALLEEWCRPGSDDEACEMLEGLQ